MAAPKKETPEVTTTVSPEKESAPVIDNLENITIEQLKETQAVKDLLKKVRKGSKYSVDARVIDEIYSMNVVNSYDADGSSIRRLLTSINTTAELQDLASLFEEVQAYRDRLTTINIKYTIIRRDLMFLQQLSESLLYQYPVIAKLKTKEQRESVMADIIKPLVNRIVLVKNILSACELMMKNLDNTYFTLKAVKDVAFVVLNINDKYKRED